MSGVKGFGTHRLRHSMAYRWISEGGNMEALRLKMGHADQETTQRFAKGNEALMHREEDRLRARRAKRAYQRQASRGPWSGNVRSEASYCVPAVRF